MNAMHKVPMQDARQVAIKSAVASMPDADKRLQESRPLLRISDSFRKIIVTGDPVPAQYDDRGILTVCVFDFLLDPQAFLR